PLDAARAPTVAALVVATNSRRVTPSIDRNLASGYTTLAVSVETDAKVERVARIARDAGVGGVLLTTQRNFAWLTGGASNRIDGSRESGAGALLVSATGRRFAVANTIEMPR